MRYMRSSDIAQVVTIDNASFDPPWPPRSYQFEVNESNVSYMVVLETHVLNDVGGFKRLINNLRGQNADQEWQTLIVGYGGLWKIQDEAHISTIATHPDHRGKGYGEIVLAGMIRQSIRLKAHYVVLEVRVSNKVAQTLYHKYGFKVTGVKEGYYRNNHEDAYDMRLDISNPQVNQHVMALYEQAQAKYGFDDQYGVMTHPRAIET